MLCHHRYKGRIHHRKRLNDEMNDTNAKRRPFPYRGIRWPPCHWALACFFLLYIAHLSVLANMSHNKSNKTLVPKKSITYLFNDVIIRGYQIQILAVKFFRIVCNRIRSICDSFFCFNPLTHEQTHVSDLCEWTTIDFNDFKCYVITDIKDEYTTAKD